jgi:hypothetical protein
VTYLSGRYSVADDDTEVASGRYTQIWRRDGKDWRLYRETWVNLACARIRVAPEDAEDASTTGTSI